jgi:hypothetical protein
MAQTNCRIDKGIYDRLNSISELTSVPISRLIGEACESWLDSKGVVKLASVYEEIQRVPKGFRRSAAEQALVKIVEEETAAEGLGQQIRWNLNLNEHMRQNPLPKAEVVEMKSSGWVTKEAMDKL